MKPVVIEQFVDEAGAPRYRLVAANGEILTSSEAYSTVWNRSRAVRRLSRLTGFPVTQER